MNLYSISFITVPGLLLNNYFVFLFLVLMEMTELIQMEPAQPLTQRSISAVWASNAGSLFFIDQTVNLTFQISPSLAILP